MPNEKPKDDPQVIEDLPEVNDGKSDEKVKGGGFSSFAKTPSPGGPIPIPYPNKP